MTNTAMPVVPLIPRKAEELAAKIPADRFNFDKAKAEVMRQTDR